MDLERIKAIADELRMHADEERARFGLYREAHEEDAFARATTDGVILFAAEVLDGITKIDTPIGNNLIALDTDSAFHDENADINFHAIELHGDDLLPPKRRKLRIAKKEYVAIMGCLVALIVTTIMALFGVYFVGTWLYALLMG